MGYKLKLFKSNKYNGIKYPTILHLGEDVYCPLCLKKSNRNHVHHVVEKEHHGRWRKQNELMICAPCHDAIHHDTSENGLVLKMRLWYYMTAIYGLLAEHNQELNENIKKTLISDPKLLEGISFLKAYRIAHKVALKQRSIMYYRMSFDQNKIHILLNDFYGG